MRHPGRHQPKLVVLVVLHVHVVVERPAPREGGGALLAAVGPLGPLAVVPLDVLLQDGEAGILPVALVAVEEEVRGVLAVLLALLTQVDHQMLLVSVSEEHRGCTKINMNVTVDATTDVPALRECLSARSAEYLLLLLPGVEALVELLYARLVMVAHAR